ncbi:MAG: IS91 family transposase [Caldilineaceae bacterium]
MASVKRRGYPPRRPMVTLAELFQHYGAAYREQYADELLPSHLRVMWCIEHCRTEVLGGHVYQCDGCGEMLYRYHSCRNRHCNQCQSDKAQAWLEAQRELLLPVPYFLVTFTLPSELRTVAYHNQLVVYNLLFRTAAQAVQELAADPRFVGGQIGMVGVLHTWKRDLTFHPHVHFLVPGGGLDFVHERWHATHNRFFVHVKPLSILFCAKMREGLQKAGLFHHVPSTAWQKAWVVHSKSVGYGEKAVAYLADYVFRIGIANQRIVKLENDAVTFWYKDSRTKRRVWVTLPVFKFIRRFLQHVLPQGFVKVRYYGFLAPGNRRRLALVRELLGADQRTIASATSAHAPLADAAPLCDALACPHCGHALRLVLTVRPRCRCPPD